MDGRWEGELAVAGDGYDAPSDSRANGDRIPLRIDVSEDIVTVFVGGPNWRATRFGDDFRLVRYRSNAILLAGDVTGGVSESWAFNATKIDADSLLIFFSRVVNSGSEGSEVGFSAMGRLERVSQE